MTEYYDEVYDYNEIKKNKKAVAACISAIIMILVLLSGFLFVSEIMRGCGYKALNTLAESDQLIGMDYNEVVDILNDYSIKYADVNYISDKLNYVYDKFGSEIPSASYRIICSDMIQEDPISESSYNFSVFFDESNYVIYAEMRQ